MRQLIHGTTLHGAQFLEPDLQNVPISYYYWGGAISEVYMVIPSARNIAIIGLGSGTAATYVNDGDNIMYYEIDPVNESIAHRWFTYLEKSKGKVRVTVGDGRLAMQKNENEGIKYDLIHIDAFTGDGIPTHLLTREAIEIYLNRLAEDGLICSIFQIEDHEARLALRAASSALVR